jgi:5-methylcytosine-specific restriction endonuclease McrA
MPYDKDYYEKNKERIKATAEKPERKAVANATRRRRYAADPSGQKRRQARYRAKLGEEEHHRRAKKAAFAYRYRNRWPTKLRLQEQLGGKCVKCGEADPIVLDFDHIIPSTKQFTLSSNNLSRPEEELQAELSKCQLLCANCHRRKTFAALSSKD